LLSREIDMGGPSDPFAAVHEYIEAFNKGDVKTMAASCANPMSILDGLAPHVWHAPRACEDWYSDAMAAGDREGAKGYVVALGSPGMSTSPEIARMWWFLPRCPSTYAASRSSSPGRSTRSRFASNARGGAS